MSFEALDSPALLMPRVGDVHGTLLRLGFTGYNAKRVSFYRQFVPLFDGGVKAQFVSRNISHVSIVILLNERESDDHPVQGRCWIKYGYPERYPHGKHIVYGFKPLTSEETYLTVNLSPDRELREFEKTFATVIERIKTKRIDTRFEMDSADGVVIEEVPSWQAVVYAVQQSLCSPRVRMTGDWWIDDDPKPKQPELIERATKYSRLPNFDRSARPRLDRRRDIRRFVRRPVRVQR
jgi:hypothetical protein